MSATRLEVAATVRDDCAIAGGRRREAIELAALQAENAPLTVKSVDLPPTVAQQVVGAHDARLDFEDAIRIVSLAVDFSIAEEIPHPSGCVKAASIAIALNCEIRRPGLLRRFNGRGGYATRTGIHHAKLPIFYAVPAPPRKSVRRPTLGLLCSTIGLFTRQKCGVSPELSAHSTAAAIGTDASGSTLSARSSCARSRAVRDLEK